MQRIHTAKSPARPTSNEELLAQQAWSEKPIVPMSPAEPQGLSRGRAPPRDAPGQPSSTPGHQGIRQQTRTTGPGAQPPSSSQPLPLLAILSAVYLNIRNRRGHRAPRAPCTALGAYRGPGPPAPALPPRSSQTPP